MAMDMRRLVALNAVKPGPLYELAARPGRRKSQKTDDIKQRFNSRNGSGNDG